MNKHEQKFYTALSDLFVGAEVDGVGGFIKLMKFKRQYYQSIEKLLKLDIYEALKKQPSFREELFEKLYQFFSLYFTQNGCIYFNHTPFHNQIYDKVYNGKDVALFWKTNMLYYVKSDKLWRSLPIKHAGYDFYIDATELEQKANNTKNGLVYAFKDVTKTPEGKPQINFVAKLSSNGNKTKIDEIRNALTKQSINLSEEEITKLFAIFEKQNEVDFFINKDAKAFLTEQFKLWIYQYFWNGSDDWSVARVEQLTILKNIANKVINFIGQFEDELVKIWNKPKFVRNSNYVVTLDKLIAKGLDIALLTNHAGMQAQIQEWQDLGIVDEKFNINEITQTQDMFADSKYKYLPFDTKHFDEDIKYKILALFDNLDEECDGVLIKSDNYQALNTLSSKYNNKISCIHIDPPYNTDTSGFLYANSYRHSSWITMMQNRYDFTEILLSENGSYLCHIDENEYENLHLLCNSYSIPSAGTLIWDKRNPLNGGSGLATQHEYVLWRTNQTKPINKRNKNILSILNKADSLIKLYGVVNETLRIEFKRWINENTELSGGEKAYDKIDDKGIVFQSVSLRAPEKRNDLKFHEPLLHPVTNKPCPVPPNGFSRSPDTLRIMQQNGDILFGIDETTQPRQKLQLKIGSSRQASTIIQDAKTGTPLLQSLGLDFPYSHPTSIYEELMSSVSHNGDEVILDYFAGSGTTAHAVFNLNREDCGRRKYILIEMGDHFTNVILPRVKKIIFSQLWEKSQPRKALDVIKQLRDQIKKKNDELKTADKYSREEFETEKFHIEIEIKQIENHINMLNKLKDKNEYYGISQLVKYYELEQYEEALAKCQYKDHEVFDEQSPYSSYVFMADEKLLTDTVSITDKQVKIDLTKLYPDIDIAETLSNLLGKKIAKQSKNSVTFTDGDKIDLTNLDLDIIKPLLWWS